MPFRTAVLSLAFSISCLASASFRPIKFGYVDFPPFTYKQNGAPCGQLIDDAKKVMTRVGLEFGSAELLPAARLFNSLKRGEVEMWLGIELYPEDIAYTKNSLANLELSVWMVKDGVLPLIKTVDDLKPYRLALMSGYGYGTWGDRIRAKDSVFKWTDLSDRHQAFKFLKKGRADILLDYTAPLKMTLPQDKISQMQYRKVQVLDVKIGVAKTYPKHQELIEALNVEMEKIKRAP